MATLTFEQSLSLTPLPSPTPSSSPSSPPTKSFSPTHPQWTWPFTTVVPGGCLMSMSVASATATLPTGYALDNLHCQFLSGSSPLEKYICTVTPLTDGKRFRVRNVIVNQKGRNIASVTCAFVNATPWTGPSMRHTVSPAGRQRIASITLDDLETGRGDNGGFMKFQRLPLVHATPRQPHTSMKPVVAHIIGPLTAPAGTLPHILGLLNISDYHVLAAPPDLHGYHVGLPVTGDASGTRMESAYTMFTSLNHTVHIHSHNFRADELMYIEITSPWTADGRGLVHSRIFSSKGDLIASCVQEAYFVLKDGQKSVFESKL